MRSVNLLRPGQVIVDEESFPLQKQGQRLPMSPKRLQRGTGKVEVSVHVVVGYFQR